MNPSLKCALLAAGALFAVACSKSEAPPQPLETKKGPQQITEKEPNDDSKSAQSITGAASEVHGAFKAGAQADEDWYRLEPTGPVIAKIDLAGVAGTETTLEVLDADRNRLMKITGGVGEAVTLPNVGCKANCFIHLTPAKKDVAGDYTLAITTTPPTPRSEREPNNRYVDAQPLVIGGGVDGFIATGDDEDWFFISAPAAAAPAAPIADGGSAGDGGSVAAVAPEIMSLSVASPPDVRLEVVIVRQSDQAPIGTYKAIDVGEDLKIPDLAGAVAPETGLYVVVRSAWIPVFGKSAKRAFNTKAAYSLELKSATAVANLEVEPNEEAAHATVLDLTKSSSIQGYVAPKGESDWFTFKTEGPSIVHAEVTGVDNVKLSLALIDPAKKNDEKDNELAKAETGDLKEPQILAGVAVPAGENFIRVEGAWKKIDKKWVRDYANAEQLYTLTLTVDPDDGTWEREPNDKAANATVVEVGHDYKGFIQPRGDVDYWRLDLKQASNVAISLNAVPKLDLKIAVRDANKKGDDGEPAIVGMIDKNKVEAEERLVVPFEPGSYLIEIREKGKESNGQKPYTLTIK